MAIEDYEIVGSYNNQRFSNIDAERTINMFEYIDMKGKKPKSLISTSGLLNTGIVFGTSTGGFRGEFVLTQNVNGQPVQFEYLVIGSDIWRRDGNNNVTRLNNVPLSTNAGYIGIDANNNPNGPQILFVDGVKGYVWDTGSTIFTPDLHVIDPAFPAFPNGPVDVCFIDGFLLVAVGGTNNFQLSALNNVYSWGLVSVSFTADHLTNIITLGTATTFVTGQPIQFDQGMGGTLPSGIVQGLTYYVIEISPTQIKIASTFQDAITNIPHNLVTDGTPPNTVNNIGQLQQGSINTHPGNIVACRTLHRRVFLFSNNYTEVWENAGIGTNLPLRRNNALLMEYGTPAVGSIVTGFDKMMFLSQDKDGLGAVMEVIGTESIPVSNRALDFQLAQYAQITTIPVGQGIADARGIFIKENGIIFYRLNFTTANATYVYNVTLSNPQTEEGKLWHEEQVLNGNRHPAQTHGYFNGNNYFGHYSLPILFQVDQAFVTNDGEAIPRIRIGRPYVPANYARIRVDRFMLDVIQGLPIINNVTGILDLLTETGMIIDTELGLDILLEASNTTPIYSTQTPIVFLSISKNGGVTYGYRQNGPMGTVGERTFRTVWRKLGVIPRGQAFVPKLEFFNQLPFIVLGAAWSYEIMPE